MVIVALLSPAGATVELAGAGYVAGAALQVVVLLAVVRPWFTALRPSRGAQATRDVVRRVAPVGLAFLFIYAAQVSARSIASIGATGDVTIVDYANRLVGAAEQAALAGFLTIVLTSWSLDSRQPESRLPVGRTFQISVGVFAGAAALGFVLAPAGTSLLLQGGNFSAADVEALASFLRWMAPGIAAHAVLMVSIRALLARDANLALTVAGFVNLAVFVAVSLPLVQVVGTDALAIGYSCSWLAASAASLWFTGMSERVHLGVARELARILPALAVAVPVALAVTSLAPGSLAQILAGAATFSIATLAVGKLTGSAAVVFLASPSWLRAAR